eukprot:scaffold264108_cov15-Tisochrysis_lutea.AAC.1
MLVIKGGQPLSSMEGYCLEFLSKIAAAPSSIPLCVQCNPYQLHQARPMVSLVLPNCQYAASHVHKPDASLEISTDLLSQQLPTFMRRKVLLTKTENLGLVGLEDQKKRKDYASQ